MSEGFEFTLISREGDSIDFGGSYRGWARIDPDWEGRGVELAVESESSTAEALDFTTGTYPTIEDAVGGLVGRLLKEYLLDAAA